MQKNQGLYTDSVEHMCLYQETIDKFHDCNRGDEYRHEYVDAETFEETTTD